MGAKTAFVMLMFLFLQLSCIDAYIFYPDINASTITNNGIAVQIIPPNVNILNGKWIVNPISHIGYDIALQITNQLGFNAASQSTLSITIDGFIPNFAQIGAMLILFSSNNNKYFSVVINLENDIPWKIYPNDHGAELATNYDIVNNIIQSGDTRWDRISNNNQWNDIGETPYMRGLRWPLNINIINDPINNKVYYECIQSQNTLITATFDSAFDANEGMDIYIMNNEVGSNKAFGVFSFEIAYSSSPTPSTFTTTTFDQTTFSPTSIPTQSWKSTATPSLSTVTTTFMTPITSQTSSSAVAIATNNQILIYLVIVSVAAICFVAGIIIGIIFYKRKMNKDIAKSPKAVPGVTMFNGESEFSGNANEMNANLQLAQLQDDDKKLCVEHDESHDTNVEIEHMATIESMEGGENINNVTIFVDR